MLTTFAITPLVFVGGVFTSATQLPPQIRNFELVNPMFYTVDAFRHSYTGQSYLPLWLSLTVIVCLMLAAVATALRMAFVGYKLRT